MKHKLTVSGKQNSVEGQMEMLQIYQLGKQILALEPNFRVLETWKSPISMSIYGIADMTVCMVPDIWEKRRLLHNCTKPQLLRSCWRRMCLWLLMVITQDIQQIVIWKQACWWTAWRPAVTLDSCIRLLGSGAIHHYFNFKMSESMRGEVLVMWE